jgi:soluble cytochrome b562
MNKLFSIALIIGMLGFSTVTLAHEHDTHNTGEIEDQTELLMKKMKKAYRAAQNSDNLAELGSAATTLTQLANQASQLDYGLNMDEKTKYKDGMQQLKTDLQQLNAAIAAKDFARAKQLVDQQINATRKQSHKALDVK